MFDTLRNKRALAVAASGGVVAIATLLGTGISAADNTWSITVKNGSKVPADVTIFYDGKAVGSRASGVRPDGGTATISIPATSPANKSKYSWKAEYAGKACGGHSVDIGGPTTVNVTCDAAPPASTSSQPKPAGGGTSTTAPALPNLRLRTPAEMEKDIDEAQRDLAKVEDELNKVDSKDKLEELRKRAEKDRETISRVKTVLDGPQRSVIETNPPDWTVVKQKTTDAGDKAKAVQNRILHCVLTGDMTTPDQPKPGSTPPNPNIAPATNIDPSTKGKHAVGCKKEF
jgi:hypothetical protein